MPTPAHTSPLPARRAIPLSVHGRATALKFRPFLVASIVSLLNCLGITTAVALHSNDNPTPAQLVRNYGELPLAFEANEGQTAQVVNYLARGPAFALFLTSTEAVLSLHPATKPQSATHEFGAEKLNAEAKSGSVMRMRLVDANASARADGVEQLPSISRYYIGNDPARWRTHVTNYAKVKYARVYPGIDLVYHGNPRQLEYDFIVAPGGDPKRIVLDFVGIKNLTIDTSGNLVLTGADGEVVQHRPFVYQDIDGVRRQVDGAYALHGARRAAFVIARYDRSYPLIIDPVLVYSTYLGGSGVDAGISIAVDSAGAAYVTGYTQSANFPTTLGANQMTSGGGNDAFVTKLDATGTTLIYSTYLGGSGGDAGQGIAVDSAGSAYVTGNTNSSDFPTTAGAARPAFAGVTDAFVTKLTAAGALVYSTYLGGSGLDAGSSIAVDSVGAAYVIGFTQSTDFPTSVGAYQTTSGGGTHAFVTKLDATGTALVYSTYLGGSGLDVGRSIAVDSSGAAYMTGYTQSSDFPTTHSAYQTTFGGGTDDAFVTKIDATGATLNYSTYLGGGGDDFGFALAVDSRGDAYVTGNTNSSNFLTTAGATQPVYAGGGDAFVTALNAMGTAPIYSTYLGGSSYDVGHGIAIDGSDAVYLTGYTQSTNFPTTAGAYQTAYAGGTDDAFVTQLTAVGALGYSTYFGGSGQDVGFSIAVDSAGAVYVTGYTFSSDFPTTIGVVQPVYAGGCDAFVTAIPANSFDEIFKDGFE